jgi:hypothetical protein
MPLEGSGDTLHGTDLLMKRPGIAVWLSTIGSLPPRLDARADDVHQCVIT